MKHGISIALLLLLLGNMASPQSLKTRIGGTVTDRQGAIIPGARIELKNDVTNSIIQAITAGDGTYTFENIAPGRYSITINASGFRTLTKIIDIGVAVTATFSFALETGGTGETDRAIVGQIQKNNAPEKNYAVIRLFYTTDRKPSGDTKPEYFYTGYRAENETQSYGVCDVSIPRGHQIGQLEAPSVFKLQFRKDPEKHVVLLGITETGYDGFFRRVSKLVASSRGKQALVFIHGYNVTFEDAARRAAQLTYDLAFDGVPILYSWPSQGCTSCYPADEETIDWTPPHLKKFLEDVAAKSGATTIHLIAHSMGNRALSKALKAIADEGGIKPLPRFQQVILAAPDIDVGVFKQLEGAIKRTCNRITLYASSEDKALSVSKWLHRFARLGETGSGIVILPGMDTIDVSNLNTDFLGHSTFADNTSVLSDIFRLFRSNSSPDYRCGLVQKRLNNQIYWAFDRVKANGCANDR